VPLSAKNKVAHLYLQCTVQYVLLGHSLTESGDRPSRSQIHDSDVISWALSPANVNIFLFLISAILRFGRIPEKVIACSRGL
jgi:hypothetical protein